MLARCALIGRSLPSNRQFCARRLAVVAQSHVSLDIIDPAIPKTLLLLNYKFDRGMLLYFWGLSSIRVCADGAANRLYDMFSSDLERARY